MPEGSSGEEGGDAADQAILCRFLCSIREEGAESLEACFFGCFLGAIFLSSCAPTSLNVTLKAPGRTLQNGSGCE